MEQEKLKLSHQTYTKINTLYKRDMTVKGNPIIIGDYSDPEIEYLKPIKWDCFEKVDGTNINYNWDGQILEIHGKTENASIPDGLLKKLQEILTVEKMQEVFPLKLNEDEQPDYLMVRIYGEGYGRKIQKCGGSYIPDGNDFVVFDININGWWLQWQDVVEIASKLNLKTVPYIGEMTIDEAESVVIKGFKSKISANKDLDAEGLVCRPKFGLLKRSGKRVIVKIKSCDYKI